MKIPLFHLEKINLKSAFLKEKRRRPGMQKKFKKKHKTDYHIHTHRTFEPDWLRDANLYIIYNGFCTAKRYKSIIMIICMWIYFYSLIYCYYNGLKNL